MKKWAVILIVCIVFACGLSVYKLFCVYSHPIKFYEEIIRFSNEYNLPADLVASVINVESSFNPQAKSNKDAIGLMQIKLDTANYLNDIYGYKNLEENELFLPINNIKYGCMYLRYLMNKFEITYTALCAYNAGETRVKGWLEDSRYSKDGKTLIYIPYSETRNYLEKIKNNLKFYSKAY